LKVALFFIDGFGIGRVDENTNPWTGARTPGFDRLLGARGLFAEQAPWRSELAIVLPVDPTLGVPGTPQSATGQVALLTGQNAPRVVGGHLSGFPRGALKDLLYEHSIFRQLANRGLRGTFANAFRPVFFERQAQGFDRFSATTHAALAGGVSIRTLEDLRAGRAVYHDITNYTLRNYGFDVPLVEPEHAALHLAGLIAEHDFTLFEFFLSDAAGHSQFMPAAVHRLETIDRFVAVLVNNLDLSDTLLVISSDHGNIEDLSDYDHTLNPVPVFLVGAGREALAPQIRAISDVTPAIMSLW